MTPEERRESARRASEAAKAWRASNTAEASEIALKANLASQRVRRKKAR
jgi:hypothetical protein